MDSARWLSCDDPRKLLEWVRGKATDRKLRLFACAFWRLWWHALADEDGEEDLESTQLLDYAEFWAEEGVRRGPPLPGGFGFGWHPLVAKNAIDAANWTIRETAGFKARLDCRRSDAKDREQAAACQARLLKEIVGNPFQPMTITGDRLTPTVLSLARTAYDDRNLPAGALDSNRLAILADALEDAGCSHPALLNHCRSGDEHVRGCWLLDLLLGRSDRSE